MMARKSKQSNFKDLIEVASMIPWWINALLALIAYIFLHNYATDVAQSSPVTSVSQLGANASHMFIKVLATFGQYIIPTIFVFGGVISAYRQRKRTTLLSDVRIGTSASIINKMSWQEFEMLVGESFRQSGYTVSETGGGGADGGVDLILRKNGDKYLVQCKQWRAYKVGVTTVRELYGVMAANGVTGGFLVTSGAFTHEAKSFANGRNISLIDGTDLTAMIKMVRGERSVSTAKEPSYYKIPPVVTDNKVCPRCGSAMVIRTARSGANAGDSFWGCTKYPKCRGIAPVE